MGLLVRRRRPIMRLAAGAATAGVAYQAGKRQAADAAADQHAAPPAEYVPQAPPPAPAGDAVGDIDHLAELHRTGVLDDEEFAAAKAKLLGL
jgi:Short C-terminal domain